MSFYDDLGEQLVQAELLLAAEEAQALQARAPRRRTRLPRPVLVGGLAAVLAAVGFVAISIDSRTPQAQAGLPILATDAVAASTVPLGEQQRALANARTAHPFETPAGTGYAFLSRAPNGRTNVCVAIPEDPGTDLPYQATCKPRAEVEARGLRFALVPEAPKVATDVLVLPVGTATATFTPAGGGTPITLPSINGVVAFQPPSNGTLTWQGARGLERDTEITRNFPASKLEFTCRDGTVIYGEQELLDRRREVCRPYGGERQLMGVPTTASESKAKPENRSRFAEGATTP